MLGIIGPMDIEVEKLTAKMEGTQLRQIGFTKFYVGELEGVPVCLARCGIGKVHAALCAQIMMMQFQVDEILNIGVAGALRDSLSVADVVIAENAVQHDMDTTPIGDPLGMISGPNIVYMPCDPELAGLLKKAAAESGMRQESGNIVSGDQFIDKIEKKDFLANTFSAAACDMEGGAIAQACYEMGVPFAACRTISDTRQGDGRMYMEKALEACAAEQRMMGFFLPLYKAWKERKNG